MLKGFLIFSTLALVPAYLYAVDGQTLINQATVNAAGGFPYVISQAGSYKLSGNLIVSDNTKDAIVIAHDFVTLDFGGFSIIGPVDCSSGTCVGTPQGQFSSAGVVTIHAFDQGSPFFNITIRNGTIQGMGYGIHLVGDSNLVEYMNVRSNSAPAISLFRADAGGSLQRVQYCNVNLNEEGILIDGGQVISNNVSSNRGEGIGIAGDAAIVNQNVVVGNLEGGLTAVDLNGHPHNNTISYGGNTFKNNVQGDVASSPGNVNTGHNVCGTALCP